MDNFDLHVRKLAAAEKEMLPSFVEDRIQSVLSSLPDRKNCPAVNDEGRIINDDEVVKYIEKEIRHDNSKEEKKEKNKYKKLLPGLKSMMEVALFLLMIAVVPVALILLGGGEKKSTSAPTKSADMSSGSQNSAQYSITNDKQKPQGNDGKLIEYTVPSDGTANLPRTKTNIIIVFKSNLSSEIDMTKYVKIINEDNSKDITERFKLSYDDATRTLVLVSKTGKFDSDMGNKIAVTVLPGLKDMEGEELVTAFTFSFTLDAD